MNTDDRARRAARPGEQELVFFHLNLAQRLVALLEGLKFMVEEPVAFLTADHYAYRMRVGPPWVWELVRLHDLHEYFDAIRGKPAVWGWGKLETRIHGLAAQRTVVETVHRLSGWPGVFPLVRPALPERYRQGSPIAPGGTR